MHEFARVTQLGVMKRHEKLPAFPHTLKFEGVTANILPNQRTALQRALGTIFSPSLISLAAGAGEKPLPSLPMRSNAAKK